MAKTNKVIGSIVEELIGLATTLIPEPKVQSPKFPSFSEFDAGEAIEKIRSMKSMLEELKENEAFTSCPRCMVPLQNIEKELKWAEQRLPRYERMVKVKQRLQELYGLLKPEEAAEQASKIPESTVVSAPTIPKEETAAFCLECSLNAILDAKRYLKEAQSADEKERYTKRLLGLKEELQHAQDHLSDKFPELATKVRKLRKAVDPIILKGEIAKPLPLKLADLETVQNEILTLAHKTL